MTGGTSTGLLSLKPSHFGPTHTAPSGQCSLACPANDAQEKAWLEASKSGRQIQKELLRKEFVNAGWPAPRLLDAMDQAPDFSFQAIQQIKMSKWSNFRVVCLGDAVYAPTPLTGMGTSLAITGAYILAAELSKLDGGEHPSQALEAYESTFRPFVEEAQKIPSLFQPSRIPRRHGRDGSSKPLFRHSPR